MNLLTLEEGERITALLSVRDFTAEQCVFMATRRGTVKKTPLEAFSRPRAAGIIAISLEDDDSLVGVDLTEGTSDVILCTSAGKAIRFAEHDVRAMGREAAGVRGITLPLDQEVNSLIVVREGLVLTASANGYGKLTEVAEFPQHGRGGQGVIALQMSERNGRMVAALQLGPEDDVMLISQGGTLVRTQASQISVLGRNTQGVRLMRIEDGDSLVGLARVPFVDGEGEGEVDGEDSEIGSDTPADPAMPPADPVG